MGDVIRARAKPFGAWLLTLGVLVVASSPAGPVPAAATDGARLASVLESLAGEGGVATARALAERFPADELEATLAVRPELAPPVLAALAAAVGDAARDAAAVDGNATDGDAGDAEGIVAYAAALARARSARVAGVPPVAAAGVVTPDDAAADSRDVAPGDAELAALAAFQVLDPGRFARDAVFRDRVLPVVAEGLVPAAALRLRRLLLALYAPVLDFDRLETLALAWGAVPRASRERERTATAAAAVEPVYARREIAASIYVLTSPFFDPGETRALLAAVRAHDPERALVVLVDGPMRAAIADLAAELGVELIDTFGLAYSPWPRDPLTLARRAGGGLHVLLRPNPQLRREADALIGRTLIQGLPAALDHTWGEPTWSVAPVPFHNGQVLITPEATWVSLHTLERPILDRLGLERVPVESFATPAGVERYVAAARAAAADLATLYRRPARFVHPLPEPGDDALMRRLGGGAGYDLDSLVTLLPRDDGTLAALVGDLDAGAALVSSAADDELTILAAAYDLAASSTVLRPALVAAQKTPRARALQGFLDVVAEHVAAEAVVHRLPLLQVPMALRVDPGATPGEDFLISWNNVVLDRRGPLRAEGFAGPFPPGDRAAAAIFERAGYELTLFPVLAESVLRNGGYRCASQHWRIGAER